MVAAGRQGLLMLAAWLLLRVAISQSANSLAVAAPPQPRPVRSAADEDSDRGGGYFDDSDDDGGLLMGGPSSSRAGRVQGDSEEEDGMGTGMVVDLGWLNRRLISRTWEHASVHLMLQVANSLPQPLCLCVSCIDEGIAKDRRTCTSRGRSFEREVIRQAPLALQEPETFSCGWCMSAIFCNLWCSYCTILRCKPQTGRRVCMGDAR